MSKTNRLTVVGLALLAGLVAVLLWNSELVRATPNRQAGLTEIKDEHFGDSNWTGQVVTVGNPLPSSLTERHSAGGNPDYFRFTRDTFPAAGLSIPHAVTTIHLYQGDSYTPTVQGAIGYIDYQVDQILLRATPANRADPLVGYLIVVQDGIVYQGGQTIINSPTWQTSTLNGLQAAHFHPLNNPTSNSHPDFSAQGAPLTFGYARHTGQEVAIPSPGNENLVYEHGIDNWRVTIRSANSPGNRPPSAVVDSIILDKFAPEYIGVTANDHDPDGDELVITTVTTPTYGEASMEDYKRIYYRRPRGTGYRVDRFSYTVTDGEFTSAAEVYAFVDCGCAADCLAFTTPLVSAASALDLDLLHRLRDRVMKPTFQGKRYVDMYYTTTPEIVTILMLNRTDLGDEAVELTKLWQDNLYSLVDGDGSARVTQTQVDAIETFLNHLSAAASPELQQLIASELARLGPLDDYVGLTVKAAKSKAIGDPVLYLPLIVK